MDKHTHTHKTNTGINARLADKHCAAAASFAKQLADSSRSFHRVHADIVACRLTFAFRADYVEYAECTRRTMAYTHCKYGSRRLHVEYAHDMLHAPMCSQCWRQHWTCSYAIMILRWKCDATHRRELFSGNIILLKYIYLILYAYMWAITYTK